MRTRAMGKALAFTGGASPQRRPPVARLRPTTLLLLLALALALGFAGCQPPGADNDLPVGTCVLLADGVTTAVPCLAPHTHRVTAVVPGDGGACPRDTVLFSQPADREVPLVTTCFAADPAR